MFHSLVGAEHLSERRSGTTPPPPLFCGVPSTHPIHCVLPELMFASNVRGVLGPRKCFAARHSYRALAG